MIVNNLIERNQLLSICVIAFIDTKLFLTMKNININLPNEFLLMTYFIPFQNYWYWYDESSYPLTDDT
jgi:hypothetical protein